MSEQQIVEHSGVVDEPAVPSDAEIGSVYLDDKGDTFRLSHRDGLGHGVFYAMIGDFPHMRRIDYLPQGARLIWTPSRGPVTSEQPAPATTRALVAVEATERLAARALKALVKIADGDLAMAPLAVYGAVEEARALLDEAITTTTDTTCSMVKDQAWSDEIASQASESVRKSLALVERALGSQ